MSKKADFPSDRSERLDRLFYAHTNEKKVIHDLFKKRYRDQSFGSFLDVGAGPGDLSQFFYEKSKETTLVEIDSAYKDTLEKRFPDAKVHTQDIHRLELSASYDLILCSHVLYYTPEEKWLSFCRKLMGLLNDGGQLLVILEDDEGDWWKLVHHFWKSLRPYIQFHYIPGSNFRQQLGDLFEVSCEFYNSSIAIESEEKFLEFMGRERLQIYDDEILARERGEFLLMADEFRLSDGTFQMNDVSVVITIEK